MFLEFVHLTQAVHPVGSPDPQAVLHLLQGSGLVAVALEIPQPSHPGSGSLTTTVLSTGFPVTACELLPPVFQPLTSPLVDLPGGSVSACRSVRTADSHRTAREAEAEPPTSAPRPTAHSAGRTGAAALAAAYRPHGPRRLSGNIPGACGVPECPNAALESRAP